MQWALQQNPNSVERACARSTQPSETCTSKGHAYTLAATSEGMLNNYGTRAIAYSVLEPSWLCSALVPVEIPELMQKRRVQATLLRGSTRTVMYSTLSCVAGYTTQLVCTIDTWESWQLSPARVFRTIGPIRSSCYALFQRRIRSVCNEQSASQATLHDH